MARKIPDSQRILFQVGEFKKIHHAFGEYITVCIIAIWVCRKTKQVFYDYTSTEGIGLWAHPYTYFEPTDETFILPKLNRRNLSSDKDYILYQSIHHTNH